MATNMYIDMQHNTQWYLSDEVMAFVFLNFLKQTTDDLNPKTWEGQKKKLVDQWMCLGEGQEVGASPDIFIEVSFKARM